MTRRKAVWGGAAVVLAALLAWAVLSGRDPDRIWCRCDAAAEVGDFRAEPDGTQVRHGATMQDVQGKWAYYYRLPTPLQDLIARLGLSGDTTVDFLATGREETTASGTWREFRRCSGEELTAAIAGRPAALGGTR